MSLLSLPDLSFQSEIEVGLDPRTLSFSSDGQLLYVPGFGSTSLSVINVHDQTLATEFVVGPMPYAALEHDGLLYVVEHALGNLTTYDAQNGTFLAQIPVEDFPAGMALDPLAGSLYVSHLFSGRITRVDLATFTVDQSVSTGNDTNLSQFIYPDVANHRLYLPQTRSNTDNLALVFDATVFPLVNVVASDSLELLREERISLDVGDRSVNMPFAVALDDQDGVLLVANAGSNDVSIIDLEQQEQLARLEVGANPRGIVFDPATRRAYVNNVLDGTLSVIDLAALEVTATLPITEIPLDAEILLGKKLFNAARVPDLTTDRWISCAVCHFDGGMDARTWLGFPDGPRNTTALFGVANTLPIHWSGDLDELQDVERTIRDIQAGTGLVPGDLQDSLGPAYQGLSMELDALAAFMASLEVQPSPHVIADNRFSAGQALFEDLGCAACHIPPLYTDRRLHDVGTGDPALEHNSHGRGTQFDTPSLLRLWRTAPYFHDGSAPTLEDVFLVGEEHAIVDRLTELELHLLIDFLISLPRSD